MNKKTILIIGAFGIIFFAGVLFFTRIDEESIQEITSKSIPSPRADKTDTVPALPEASPLSESASRSRRKTADTGKSGDRSTVPVLGERPQSEPLYLLPEIEAVRDRIYALEIESANQIPLLDELVETGDRDTRELWGDDWNNIDDWKKKRNGFSLEKGKDGTLVFTPDELTAREYTFFENPLAYTYDAEHKEFVSEIDYFGKTIYNVAKFINTDVLVMMTISGQKVDLTVYQKNAPPQ